MKIISQDKDTVTFSVTQSCDSEWIASDFIGSQNELNCIKNRFCGVPEQFTATCLEGVTIVDIYIRGNSFGQTDGSLMVIPKACDANVGDLSLCHFRYVLKCCPSRCEKSYGAKEKRLRRSSDFT